MTASSPRRSVPSSIGSQTRSLADRVLQGLREHLHVLEGPTSQRRVDGEYPGILAGRLFGVEEGHQHPLLEVRDVGDRIAHAQDAGVAGEQLGEVMVRRQMRIAQQVVNRTFLHGQPVGRVLGPHAVMLFGSHPTNAFLLQG